MPFYYRDVTFSSLMSFYYRGVTFSSLISFYYRDVTFSSLMSFYYRGVTFSTLISFYYRDVTFSSLIPFYYCDVTFSSLMSFYCCDMTFPTLISFYYRDVTFSSLRWCDISFLDIILLAWWNIFYYYLFIVRELWLAERRVCMRVCKHGCDVKMFCFSRANHASTNLKKVLSWKTRQVYFIYPFPRRLKLEKSLETCCVNFFFAWADILSEKNPYFGKHFFFGKTKTDYTTGDLNSRYEGRV